MQTFRKLPTTVPIDEQRRRQDQRGPARCSIIESSLRRRSDRGAVTRRRGSASATSSAVRPSVSTTSVGDLPVERRPGGEDVGDLGERAGGGQRGPAGEPARVGPEPVGQHRRGRPRARRRSRTPQSRAGSASRRTRPPPVARTRRAAAPSARRATAPPSRGRPARRPRRRSTRIDRPSRASSSTSASRNGRPSRSARIRPTVDLPSRGSRPAPGPGGSCGSCAHSRIGPSLRRTTSRITSIGALLPGVELELLRPPGGRTCRRR